jgi:hypothetical protein
MRIEEEERARIAKVEEALKDRFAREKTRSETQTKAAIDKAKRDVARTAEQQIRMIRANQDAVLKARVDAEREAAAKKLAEALGAEKVRAFEEKTRLTEQLAEMQRRLEKKTAHELGEPAELDLYETLRAEFPGDRIARVAKGVKGPDIIFEVVHNGAITGSIVIDCKNQNGGRTASLRNCAGTNLPRVRTSRSCRRTSSRLARNSSLSVTM